jgi:hypothetical protein
LALGTIIPEAAQVCTPRFDLWRIAGMLFYNAQAEVSIHDTSNMASHCIFSTVSGSAVNHSNMIPLCCLSNGLGHEIADCPPTKSVFENVH